MNEAIYRSNKNSVFVVGCNHLIEISSDKNVNERYEILSINVSNISSEKKSYLSKDPLYPQYKLDFALNPENAMQLNFSENPYCLKFKQIKQLINRISLKEKCSISRMVGKLIDKKNLAFFTAISTGIIAYGVNHWINSYKYESS